MSPAGAETEPPKPPLPAPKKFPFQFAGSGNHTSAMIAESGVGVSVTATRQKSTGAVSVRKLNTTGESFETATAEVILPLVTGNLARSSQDALAADENTTASIARAVVILVLLSLGNRSNRFLCFTATFPHLKSYVSESNLGAGRLYIKNHDFQSSGRDSGQNRPPI